MSLDIQAMVDAIYAEFKGDADLLDALGGAGSGAANERLYNKKARQNPTSPYVVFQYITGIPDPTFTSDGEITQWQFSVFHKSVSPLDETTINDVLKKLTAAYDDATLTISDHTSIAFTRGVSGFLPTQDKTQQYVVTYEFMIEDA